MNNLAIQEIKMLLLLFKIKSKFKKQEVFGGSQGSTWCVRLYEPSDIVWCSPMSTSNYCNFQSDSVFNRKPMKLDKQRTDIIVSTAKPGK